MATQYLILCIVLSAANASIAPKDYSLTMADVKRASDILKERIENTTSGAEGNTTYKLYIAGFIRLGFHSCVGKQCVGCLNLKDSNNNGLQRSVEELESVHSNLTSEGGPGFYISRGDLWALAAKVAYDVGVGRGESETTVRFRYGRKDCTTPPSTEEMVAFPDRRWGIDEALRYFDNLGFNVNETVALLGFHTLGIVRDLGKDEIVDQWVATPDLVNNQYFIDLTNSTFNWTQVPETYTDLSHPIYSWERELPEPEPKRIMLNPDIALLRNFTVSNNETGEISCTMDTCAVSSTASIVEEFARDVTGLPAWRKAASSAYTKLIERGYESLQDPSPTPFPTEETHSSTTPKKNHASFIDSAATCRLMLVALTVYSLSER